MKKPTSLKQKITPLKIWYDEVTNDLNKFSFALDYYRAKAKEGSRHTILYGTLGELNLQTPGLVQHYDTIQQDCSSIRKWLEETLKTVEAQKYKYYMTDREIIKEFGELKSTEISKFVRADNDVIDLYNMVRMIAATEHNLDALTEGLRQRSIILGRLVAIYKEGMEERWIDSTQDFESE